MVLYYKQNADVDAFNLDILKVISYNIILLTERRWIL